MDYEAKYKETVQPTVTTKGWVAKNYDGEVRLFFLCKPQRIDDKRYKYWYGGQNASKQLSNDSFPDLKWEDEPIEVTLRSVTDTSELDHNSYENIAYHFIKWGAEHAPLPEDTVLFQKGVEEGKRLMMEDAVDGTIDFEYFGYKVIRPDPKQLDTLLESMNHGDKVRIIIVKEK